MMLTTKAVTAAFDSQLFRDSVPELAALYNYYDQEKLQSKARGRRCSGCSYAKDMLPKVAAALESNPIAAKKAKVYWGVEKLIVNIKGRRGRSKIRYI